MNREFEAMKRAMFQQHNEEVEALMRQHKDDITCLDSLAQVMARRKSLLASMNQLPEPQMDLGEQLPQMTRNWQQNGRYQQ